MPERLQKIIAAAGITSRRSAEKLISSGAVSINGQIVTELGTKADPERDHIRVNGKLLHGAERQIYLLMNKPKDTALLEAIPRAGPPSWIFCAEFVRACTPLEVWVTPA